MEIFYSDDFRIVKLNIELLNRLDLDYWSSSRELTGMLFASFKSSKQRSPCEEILAHQIRLECTNFAGSTVRRFGLVVPVQIRMCTRYFN